MIDLNKGDTPTTCGGCKYHNSRRRMCDYGYITGRSRLGVIRDALGTCYGPEWREAIKVQNCTYWTPWRKGATRKGMKTKMPDGRKTREHTGKYLDPVTKRWYIAFDPEKAFELWKQGLNDKQIAAKIGASHTAVGNWRRARGLESCVKIRRWEKRQGR